MVNDEPIKIEMYECPKCNNRLECSYEEARAHVNMPMGTQLPVGLVYKDSTLAIYQVVSNEGKINKNHEFNQSTLALELYGKLNGEVKFLVTTKDFTKNLKSLKYSLLTPKEFDEFKSNYASLFPSLLTPKPSELIRTTSELEALANSKT